MIGAFLFERFTSLRRDRRGLALTEFAFAAPLIIVLGTCGLEMANYALIRMRLSQVTMNIADNSSRIGLDTGLGSFQMTEGDVNDTILGAGVSGKTLDLFNNGRIVISSLEMNSDGGQWIHWQRCKGRLGATAPYTALGQSAYGAENYGQTGTALAGMGPPSARVTAPSTSTAVMYVEVNYRYQPLFGFLWADAPTGNPLGSLFANSMRTIRYGNAFMVRDNRNLSRMYPSKNLLTDQFDPTWSCDKFDTPPVRS